MHQSTCVHASACGSNARVGTGRAARFVNGGDPVPWLPPHVKGRAHLWCHVCAPVQLGDRTEGTAVATEEIMLEMEEAADVAEADAGDRSTKAGPEAVAGAEATAGDSPANKKGPSRIKKAYQSHLLDAYDASLLNAAE